MKTPSRTSRFLKGMQYSCGRPEKPVKKLPPTTYPTVSATHPANSQTLKRKTKKMQRPSSRPSGSKLECNIPAAVQKSLSICCPQQPIHTNSATTGKKANAKKRKLKQKLRRTPSRTSRAGRECSIPMAVQRTLSRSCPQQPTPTVSPPGQKPNVKKGKL